MTRVILLVVVCLASCAAFTVCVAQQEDPVLYVNFGTSVASYSTTDGALLQSDALQGGSYTSIMHGVQSTTSGILVTAQMEGEQDQILRFGYCQSQGLRQYVGVVEPELTVATGIASGYDPIDQQSTFWVTGSESAPAVSQCEDSTSGGSSNVEVLIPNSGMGGLAFDSNSNLLYASSAEGVLVWDTTRSVQLPTLNFTGPGYPPVDISVFPYTPTDTWLVVSTDTDVYIWDVASKTVQQQWGCTEVKSAIVLSANSMILLCMDAVTAFSPLNGDQLWQISFQDTPVSMWTAGC